MTVVKKVPLYLKALREFLLANASRPFQWGEHDCSLFSANAIKAISGVDIAADFRGKYTDEKSAFALIKTITGGTTVEDATAYCASKFGLIEHAHPLLAKRGDLALIKNKGQLIAGVVHISGAHAVAVSETGLVTFPITDVARAWGY